ncbi:MAG: bifunctional demethylmenaquinone methyltransferase/2-methoxy-6-polyprenyl-1,4-benzoquinol methylase UbiE [Sphingobacteriales bacterium]|nr:MAG: bifunctional demethylmenaquinone methyltransferase/2-methoxy-6-polyprenyl-1,4-benzoquinol methylase UbiE [Sphingobacteriales bacterium]TAF82703.1 MAG: bifunctional demethylmenaquinone methyltransferase/2-methoxy-6-polyprenyl-1,4-benzoquinol methylase UbiE [Sphingobacteriales bacterium]
MIQKITPYQNTTDSKTKQVATMFNNISATYDFLNHFLSLGIDIIWRKKAIKQLLKDKPKYILDIATGTGDFAFEAIKILKPEKIMGVDISAGMLAVADKKIIERQKSSIFEVQLGDSENLAFANNTFDAATVAYGVRNFDNLLKGLSDIHRVLKTGGKLVVLEFSKPKVFPVKQLYTFYFKHITPAIGKLFSKDNGAYTYLPASVEAFPDGDNFLLIMKNAGFNDTKCTPLAFGICSIYTGIK